LPFAALAPFALFSGRRDANARAVPPTLTSHILSSAALVLAGAGFALAAFILAAIVLSLSRMGFISALVSLVFVAIAALASGSGSRRRVPLALGTAILAILLAVALPTAPLIQRFGEIERNGEDRSPPWRDTLNLIADYPLVGSGLGSYHSAFLKYKRSAPALLQDYAHNDYLQYLAELGIVGFTLALIPVLAIAVRLSAGIRHPRSDIRWLSLACAGS